MSLDPIRRDPFYFLDEVGDRHGARKCCQKMDILADSSTHPLIHSPLATRHSPLATRQFAGFVVRDAPKIASCEEFTPILVDALRRQITPAVQQLHEDDWGCA